LSFRSFCSITSVHGAQDIVQQVDVGYQLRHVKHSFANQLTLFYTRGATSYDGAKNTKTNYKKKSITNRTHITLILFVDYAAVWLRFDFLCRVPDWFFHYACKRHFDVQFDVVFEFDLLCNTVLLFVNVKLPKYFAKSAQSHIICLRLYTLKRISIMSPSLTRYSLPSRRRTPALRHSSMESLCEA